MDQLKQIKEEILGVSFSMVELMAMMDTNEQNDFTGSVITKTIEFNGGNTAVIKVSQAYENSLGYSLKYGINPCLLSSITIERGDKLKAMNLISDVINVEVV